MHALLSEAIDDYSRFRTGIIARGTLKGEASTLKRFLAVNGNVWMHSINDSHVTRFREEASKTRQPASMANDYTHLRGFFAWAHQSKRLAKDVDPMYGWRKPKKSKRERNRVHFSQFGRLLAVAESRCERDRAALALLLYTLGRDGEITDLRVRDLDLDAGYIMYRVHKTNEEDRIPICAELDAELRKWLVYYTEQVGMLEPYYYLVPARTTRGVRDAEQGVYTSAEQLELKPERRMKALNSIVIPALKDIGFPVVDDNGKPCGEGAHTIRRSGARALFDRLVDLGYDGALRIVQSMLHHASVQTTELYLGITSDRRTRDDLIRGQALYSVPGVTELRSTHGAEAAG